MRTYKDNGIYYIWFLYVCLLQCPHLIKLLTLDSSPNESTSDVVTAMKPHPLHPMHFVVASKDRLRLMDIRMEAHPVGWAEVGSLRLF